MFRRIILSGGTIAYAPTMVVKHHHRSGMRDLGRQMYGYGTGMAASLARCAFDDRRYARDIVTGVPAGVRVLLSSRKRGRPGIGGPVPPVPDRCRAGRVPDRGTAAPRDHVPEFPDRHGGGGTMEDREAGKIVLSVPLPFRDPGGLLADTLGRFEDLCRDGVEFVLVDDGSTDGSTRTAEDWVTEHDRAVLITPEKHGGVSWARDVGVRAAHGEYVWMN